MHGKLLFYNIMIYIEYPDMNDVYGWTMSGYLP